MRVRACATRPVGAGACMLLGNAKHAYVCMCGWVGGWVLCARPISGVCARYYPVPFATKAHTGADARTHILLYVRDAEVHDNLGEVLLCDAREMADTRVSVCVCECVCVCVCACVCVSV